MRTTSILTQASQLVWVALEVASWRLLWPLLWPLPSELAV